MQGHEIRRRVDVRACQVLRDRGADKAGRHASQVEGMSVPGRDEQDVATAEEHVGPGKHLVEAAHERGERHPRQLVELHPLAEHAARRKMGPDHAVEIHREQVVHACKPRVRGLGDDHVVGTGRVRDERAAVVDVNGQARIRHRIAVVRLEEPIGCDHRGLDLDHVHAPQWMGQRAPGRDTRAVAHDCHPRRIGRPHQGQLPEQDLGLHVEAGAGVGLAVEAQRHDWRRRAHAVDADGALAALGERQQFLARHLVAQLPARLVEGDRPLGVVGDERAKHAEGEKPAVPGRGERDQDGEGGDRQRRHRRAGPPERPREWTTSCEPPAGPRTRRPRRSPGPRRPRPAACLACQACRSARSPRGARRRSCRACSSRRRARWCARVCRSPSPRGASRPGRSPRTPGTAAA